MQEGLFADFIHNFAPGGNVLRGKLDFTVPLPVGNIAACVAKVFGDQVHPRVFKYPDKLLVAIDHDPPAVLGLSNYWWNAHLIFARPRPRAGMVPSASRVSACWGGNVPEVDKTLFVDVTS